MGWNNDHSHIFITQGRSRKSRIFYITPEADDVLDPDMRNDYTFQDLAPHAHSKFFYEYDPVNCWIHEIPREKTVQLKNPLQSPTCIKGNIAPPENSGPISGHYEWLKIIGNPKHPQHPYAKDWFEAVGALNEFDLKNH